MIKNHSDRAKKDYFILAFKDVADGLISDKEKEEIKAQENADKRLYSLKLERITDELISQYMDEATLKYTHFLYLMQNCTSGSSILAEGLTDEEASIIGENADILPGVTVTTDWARQYSNSTEFASVLGKVTTKNKGYL